MADFEILSLQETEKWNSLLHRLPVDQQDVYFTPEYYSLYEKLGDGKAQCFVFEKNDDVALYPFLINSVNSLGYEFDKEYYDIQGAYGYNGVVANSFTESFTKAFHEAFENYCSENNVIAEFTRFHPLLQNHKFSRGMMDVEFDRNTVCINLKQPYEDIFKAFQSTTRKQIRRCNHKYNINCKVHPKDDSKIEVFYSIYKDAMNRVQSSNYLYFNIEYFKELISKTQASLFIASIIDKPISAIIVLNSKHYIHGHLGGALTEFLCTSSSSFLYSEIIKYGIQKGCKYFHVGGGVTNNPNDKLLKFKRNFSNTLLDFYIGKRIHNLKIYNDLVYQWTLKNPGKIGKYNHLLLKYRY